MPDQRAAEDHAGAGGRQEVPAAPRPRYCRHCCRPGDHWRGGHCCRPGDHWWWGHCCRPGDRVKVRPLSCSNAVTVPALQSVAQQCVCLLLGPIEDSFNFHIQSAHPSCSAVRVDSGVVRPCVAYVRNTAEAAQPHISPSFPRIRY